MSSIRSGVRCGMGLTGARAPGLSEARLTALKSDLAGLYLRVAETLEQSAQLADQHAERCRSAGRTLLVDVERGGRVPLRCAVAPPRSA